MKLSNNSSDSSNVNSSPTYSNSANSNSANSNSASSNSGQNDINLNLADKDLDQALSDLEANITALRQRHIDITQAQTEKQELRVRLNRAQQELKQHRTKRLQQEVKSIQTRMEEIELILESQLLSWISFKEPFWQAIRFGGIGLIIGWWLHTLAT